MSKAQLKSQKSPINFYHLHSRFPLLPHVYKPVLSCIHTSTDLPPLTNHQIYSRQIFQWIWVPADTLKYCFNIFWQLLTDSGPHRVHKELNSLIEIYFTFLIFLLYCWPFIIFHSLPHHSNSTLQIWFIFIHYNSLVWHISPSIPVIFIYLNSLISLLQDYFYPFSEPGKYSSGKSTTG